MSWKEVSRALVFACGTARPCLALLLISAICPRVTIHRPRVTICDAQGAAQFLNDLYFKFVYTVTGDDATLPAVLFSFAGFEGGDQVLVETPHR